MKKIFSVALALFIIAGFTVVVWAESMQISTHGDVEYQLAFPADTEIPWESLSTDIGGVSAEKMTIEPFKQVVVTVASENGFKLVSAENSDSVIEYKLAGADSIVFLPGSVGTVYPLSAEITEREWAKASSGEHSDVLTFTMEYADA